MSTKDSWKRVGSDLSDIGDDIASSDLGNHILKFGEDLGKSIIQSIKAGIKAVSNWADSVDQPDGPIESFEAKVEKAAEAFAAEVEKAAEAVETEVENAAETVEAEVENAAETVEAEAENAAETVEAEAENAAETIEAEAEEVTETITND